MQKDLRQNQTFHLAIVLVLALSAVFPAAAARAEVPLPADEPYNGPAPVISQALTAAVSPELGSIKVEPSLAALAPQTGLDKPLPRPQDEKPDPNSDYVDTVVQENYPGPSLLTVFRSFNGLSANDDQTVLGGVVTPPDTDGAVGPNHYVQIVNLVFAVYDKNGNVLGGPWPNNVLWDTANTGDACESSNDGDPIVLYDQLADRWLLSQFALPNYPNGPFYECVAISTTGDPLGSWYLYTFLISNTKMDDYPKFGVWPDGYYMSINQFDSGVWAGAGAVVFERSQMLTGGATRMVYFDLFSTDPNLGGFLPSNLEGPTPPPSGAPNYFVLLDDDSWGYTAQDQLQVWEFHVDWTTPANSTFTHAADLATAAFDTNMCGYSRSCIPQPGTSQTVDALSDRLMFSLQYRNFGTHQSMVVNHTVDADNADHAGIRWYELRKTASNWSIYQQGTYSPDSADRWMGSVSIDSVGNIALGYSVSSTSIYPSVRFTGRLAGDPLGQMTQGENSIVEGGGSQLDANRWGDYSAMMVDPVDDCTFWYTQEYVSVTGSWNWATRIGAFKMPNCGADWGDITGTVTNSVTSAPIENARVFLNGGGTVYTNSSGQYTFSDLPAGTYDMTVTAYGYNPGSATGVVVTDGNTTTRNFSLVPKTMVTVSGSVTDGSQKPGKPLYATITIPEYPGSPIYTDPVTGAYSVVLESGTTHHFTVTSTGYQDGSASVTPAGSPITLNFALLVDSVSCSAPGYAYVGFNENFDGIFPPSGWTVVDYAGTGVVWNTNTFWLDGNYTGGSGTAAAVDSDEAGSLEFDTALVSPVLTPSTLPTLTLTYLANYQNYANYDYLDLDISVNGGPWTNILRWNEDHGTMNNTPGVTVIQDLSAYATGPFQLRWHYYDPRTGDWDWYAQVDNVSMGTCTAYTFNDVLPSHWAWDWIERLSASGITTGCGGGNYCPGDSVTRAQMAVFLERGMNGSTYNPPAGSGAVFADVPLSHWAVNWIEKLFADHITTGCGGGNYCPEDPVTRAQMAVFLLRAKHGSSYIPPDVAPTFGDTAGHWAEDWIEQLYAEGITSGCGGGNYCPEDPVTRDQMAVFLVRTFNLP